MFEVETMKHYSQWTEAQINYVTCLRSQYDLDLKLGMKPQLLFIINTRNMLSNSTK